MSLRGPRKSCWRLSPLPPCFQKRRQARRKPSGDSRQGREMKSESRSPFGTGRTVLLLQLFDVIAVCVAPFDLLAHRVLKPAVSFSHRTRRRKLEAAVELDHHRLAQPVGDLLDALRLTLIGRVDQREIDRLELLTKV